MLGLRQDHRRVELVALPDLQADQEAMTDRPKRPRDANQLAKFIVDVATGDADAETPLEKSAAQRKGGLKGGAARAASLTPEQRAEIARTAADARWKKGS